MDVGEAFQLSTTEAAVKTRDRFLPSSDLMRGGREGIRKPEKGTFHLGTGWVRGEEIGSCQNSPTVIKFFRVETLHP